MIICKSLTNLWLSSWWSNLWRTKSKETQFLRYPDTNHSYFTFQSSMILEKIFSLKSFMSVGRSVIISYKAWQLHFHAHSAALDHSFLLSIPRWNKLVILNCQFMTVYGIDSRFIKIIVTGHHVLHITYANAYVTVPRAPLLIFFFLLRIYISFKSFFLET